jgi:pilus assembly protein CpaE
MSKSYGALDMEAIRLADDVLMVTQLDLPCLRNVVRLMMTFDDDSELRDKIKIVVNRVGQDSGQISLKKAQETINRDIYWQIPNDYRVMVEVRNNGVPLIDHAPKAGITNSVNKLAAALCGVGDAESEDPDADTKTRSWLKLWPAK